MISTKQIDLSSFSCACCIISFFKLLLSANLSAKVCSVTDPIPSENAAKNLMSFSVTISKESGLGSI